MDNGMNFYPKGLAPYAPILIEADPLKLRDLLIQTAACVIQETRTMPTKRELPVVGIGSILANSKINDYSSPEESQNALQSQVQFLYEFVKMECERPSSILAEEERAFIALALSKYQEFKTKICEEEEKEHGKGWGSATGFYKANWTGFNSQFLTLRTRR